MSHRSKKGSVESVPPAEETEASSGNFLTVMQQLLEQQQTQMQDERAKWAQREEDLKSEKLEERARWEAQQEALQKDRDAERMRANEEWGLRLEELRLRTEALKRSEAATVQAIADTAEKEEKRRLQKRAEKMEPWRDSDLPEAYFNKFEMTMKEAGIPDKEWPSRLISLLTGKALTAFHNNVPQTAMEPYTKLKEALLEALGFSLDQCRRTFWSFSRKAGETPQEAVRRIEAAYDRMVRKCDTEQEFRWEMVSGRYLSTYSAEVSDYVQVRQPKTTIEMANLVQQYFDAKQTWREPRPFRRPSERGSNGGLRGDNERVDRKQGEQHEQGSGNRSSGNKGQKIQGSGGVKQEPGRNDGLGGPKCFNCGKRGHKKFECPNRVGRVTSPGRIGSPKVVGRVGEVECEMTIDSGALITMVRADLVREEDFTGELVTLKSVCGNSFTTRAAKVWLHLGDYVVKHEVAVSEQLGEAVLLGMDLGLLNYLLQLEQQQRKQGVAVNAITRAQAKKQEEEARRDEELDAQDNALPKLLEPSVASDAELDAEQAVASDSVVDVVQSIASDAESDAEQSFVVDVDDLDHAGSDSLLDDAQLVGVDDISGENGWPLPCLTGTEEDRKALIEQQKSDGTLESVRGWAKSGENGYGFQNRIIVHREATEHGEEWTRIVVPNVRRKDILKLSHSSLTGGHFSVRKTVGILRRVFTWPGVTRDVKAWCRSCVECQKAARAVNCRAPLQPLPVIPTPFSRLAFDLVGPLPRTKQGHRYLLTCMCLGSKYPDAVPLKRVDAESVAEGMCEIFSRTGIPQELLTDQGSVFIGKLHKALYKVLGIEHLKTTAYHPQTDGCLERWHACLKAMLRKQPNRQQDWDRLVKYMLFAYRAAPHHNTGFSSFEMIYGRQLRGPLDLVKDGWLAGDLSQVDAVEWVNVMREKLKVMSDIVVGKEQKAKEQMKKGYDKHAVEREFSVGNMVLVRTPDLEGKLSDLWDGPYEVIRKVSSVVYELAVPSRRSKSLVAHVNRLKLWKNPEAHILRVVMAEEEQEAEAVASRMVLSKPNLSKEQQEQLQELLREFGDVLSSQIGTVEGVEHTIDTGEHVSVRVAPYRLAPAWRDQLREEVHTLVEQGILKPSHSPWYSPMVPVRKPDGSVCLCIDFRRVNSITTPDPFQIPLIEDLIDSLSEAKFITKLDMNKGFY